MTTADEARQALTRGFSRALTAIPDYLLDEMVAHRAEQLGGRAVMTALAPQVWSSAVGERLATAEVVQLLGVSRQALAKRVANGTLLGFPGRGTTLYPTWQFEFSDPARVKPIAAQAFSAWVAESGSLHPSAVVAWFTTPQPDLDGLAPAEHLLKGLDDAALIFSARVTAARLSQ